MSIPIEETPLNTPPELKEWLQRMLINIAGSFEELELENDQLRKRIETLESNNGSNVNPNP